MKEKTSRTKPSNPELDDFKIMLLMVLVWSVIICGGLFLWNELANPDTARSIMGLRSKWE
jgi:hypothetical protein